jgi:ubiquinone/menaquinone biosynthesis C-methylase UbiE
MGRLLRLAALLILCSFSQGVSARTVEFETMRVTTPDIALAPDGQTLVFSGTAADLSDVLSTVGTKGRVLGIDPTKAFIETARTRAAKHGATNARFEVGDIRGGVRD